jgi:hypothetical protein
LVLEWCEGVSLILNIPLALMCVKGIRPNIPMLVSSGPDAMMVQSSPASMNEKELDQIDDRHYTQTGQETMQDSDDTWGLIPMIEEPWEASNISSLEVPI